MKGYTHEWYKSFYKEYGEKGKGERNGMGGTPIVTSSFAESSGEQSTREGWLRIETALENLKSKRTIVEIGAPRLHSRRTAR